jgi:hypothetical protein
MEQLIYLMLYVRLSRARWLKETGMVDREYKFWMSQRPKCDSMSQGFVSVRLKDFYPTLVVLSVGMMCSAVIFVLELVHHKTKYGICWPKDSETRATSS